MRKQLKGLKKTLRFMERRKLNPYGEGLKQSTGVLKSRSNTDPKPRPSQEGGAFCERRKALLLYVYDQSMVMLGVVEEMASLIWRRKYSACGSFSLLAPATRPIWR